MSEERSEGPEEFDNPPSFFPYDEESFGEQAQFEPGAPVECRVDAVYAAQSEQTIQRYVLLSDGIRKLPILIGQFEASSITFALEGQQPDRPLTHDLMKSMLEQMGGTVTRILIDDLWGTTYYAKIFVHIGKREFSLDSRPSDAIALAIRVNCPIFVAEGILDQAGH